MKTLEAMVRLSPIEVHFNEQSITRVTPYLSPNNFKIEFLAFIDIFPSNRQKGMPESVRAGSIRSSIVVHWLKTKHLTLRSALRVAFKSSIRYKLCSKKKKNPKNEKLKST